MCVLVGVDTTDTKSLVCFFTGDGGELSIPLTGSGLSVFLLPTSTRNTKCRSFFCPSHPPARFPLCKHHVVALGALSKVRPPPRRVLWSILFPRRRTPQAYGLIWPGDYGVYNNWENTVDQRREMLAYDSIGGFEQCGPPGDSADHEGGDVD